MPDLPPAPDFPPAGLTDLTHLTDLTAIPLVGIGADIHAFAPTPTPDSAPTPTPHLPLRLAGLDWPDEIPLAGHSDGDVVAHAACNALFSAAGLGDLGSNFGTDRPEWRGASGPKLLAEAANRVRAAGYRIGNVSVQLIGVRPKIGPRRAEAEAVLSEAAGAPVRISAATTDGLGFTGRAEGLAAIATALIVAIPVPIPAPPGPTPPGTPD